MIQPRIGARTLLAAASLIVSVSCAESSAQTSSSSAPYPTRPVRLVVPAAPGSSADILARIAARLSESWGQNVVVDNRIGAAGIVATGFVAKAAPDGYTLLTVAGTHAINHSLYNGLPYDTVGDFAAVSLIGVAPLVLVAHPSVPVTSIAQLIALAKAKPGQLNYASGGAGTSSHLAMELFKSMAAVNIVHVPYTGGAPVTSAILSGEVQLTPGGLLQSIPLIKNGKLKALGVTGARRSPAAPDIPTVSESGLAGYVVQGWWGILAPAKTQRAIVMQVSRDLAQLLQRPDVGNQLAASGIEVVRSSPDDFDAYIKKDIATWAKVIKDAGIARVDI